MDGIDLFSGAGGISLGARQAGINVRLSVELDEYAAATYLHNHPNTRVLVSDVADIDDLTIKESEKISIVFGGPPCQGFSTSNQRNRGIKNKSNWLFQEFFRIVNIIKPDWVVFENVKGLAETAGGIFLNQVLSIFKNLEYTTTHGILNAADFGVPQMRNRLFIIGNHHGIKIELPKPTVTQYVSVKNAIDDLPELSNGANVHILPYKSEANSKYSRLMRNGQQKCSNHYVTRNAPYILERYKHIPQGGNWENIPYDLMKNYKDRHRCHTGVYRRLKEDSPSVVIGNYRKNMLVHPTQDRGLSVREAARLQSFPDWYEFKGSIGFQQQQVGNAVPPLLAKAVFEAILQNKRKIV